MKVSLIDYTGKGMHQRYAAELLCFTKNTRLNMTASGLEKFKEWSDEDINNELLYMSNTIPSSWEMIEYTFIIEECDRGFTHQLVRNRHGSYAQQSMRVTDMTGFGFNTGPSIEKDEFLQRNYNDGMEFINDLYKYLIEHGAEVEDSRGVLPTNIHTNIVAKFNLRSCAEIVSKRSSVRTQGLYRQFVQSMADCILKVHPMFDCFLRNKKHDAADFLEALIQDVCSDSTFYDKNFFIKQLDILRG